MNDRVVRAIATFLSMSILALTYLPVSAAAENLSPVGLWRTVDEETNKDQSIIAIWEEKGKVFGKIDSILDQEPGESASPVCDKCEDELKGQPLIGMTIIWDLEQENDEWSGVKILDPNIGKSYLCFIKVEEGGKKLKVRGFIGFALLGRSQYWYRVE